MREKEKKGTKKHPINDIHQKNDHNEEQEQDNMNIMNDVNITNRNRNQTYITNKGKPSYQQIQKTKDSDGNNNTEK